MKYNGTGIIDSTNPMRAFGRERTHHLLGLCHQAWRFPVRRDLDMPARRPTRFSKKDLKHQTGLASPDRLVG